MYPDVSVPSKFAKGMSLSESSRNFKLILLIMMVADSENMITLVRRDVTVLSLPVFMTRNRVVD